MKASFNRPVLRNKIETPQSLLSPYTLVPLWIFALCLPNLIYSGIYWYETLHIMKWVLAAAPVAIAGVIAGVRIMRYGAVKLSLKVDGFACLWLLLFILVLIQPLWTPIRSVSAFAQESLAFIAVVGFYIMTLNSFPNKVARPLIWLANINGALNVIFAELQTRPDMWADYSERIGNALPLILPTPGNYIGNTGQQNMFGLWLAICILNSIYLYVAYAKSETGKPRPPYLTVLNLLLMLINMWGLWNSTSRSAILSLAVGLFFLIIMFFRLKSDRAFIKRFGAVFAVLAITLAGSFVFNSDRTGALVSKTLDIIQNSETIGGRTGIWATSRAMFSMYPVKGVGLGQYKWHYMEAQRKMFDLRPEAEWQYTHWAHNEFLQWFCEGGIFGGLIMVAMLAWWGVSLLAALIKKKETSSEAIWANALLSVILFAALWTRPFHRIENLLWLSLAFAVANREILLPIWGKISLNVADFSFPRLVGVPFVAISVLGIWFLADGMYGDRQIRLALSTNNAAVQREYLEEAHKHLMVKLEAEKQLAYHYISLGEAAQDKETFLEGYERMFAYFHKEPHSQELNFMLNLAQRIGDVERIEYLTGFLKPGSFTIQRNENPAHESSPAQTHTVETSLSDEAAISQ